MKPKHADTKEKSLFQNVERGTSDDMEVLLSIIRENPGLKRRVMEKVKQAKVRIEVERKNTQQQQRT